MGAAAAPAAEAGTDRTGGRAVPRRGRAVPRVGRPASRQARSSAAPIRSLKAALRRLGQAGITLLGGGIFTFGLLAAAPGDPAQRVLQARGVVEPTPAQEAAVRVELGLDRGLPLRFWDWFTGVLQGDLGLSCRTGRPVMDEFAERLPATLILTGTAFALAVVLSLGLGLLAALRAGGPVDHTVRAVTLVGLVTPGFLFGIVLLDLVVVRLGYGRIIADGTWATVFPPALTLALGAAATWARVLRATLLEAGSASYLAVSTARGASPWRLLFVHRLPNALPPYLTLVALGIAALLGGAPVIESVFTWPGVGRYTVEAIDARDMPVVVGFTICAILAYVVMSLVVDALIALIDPRRRR